MQKDGDDKKPASEKFWELEKRIKEDKRRLGVVNGTEKIRGNIGYCSSYQTEVIIYDDYQNSVEN